MLRTSRIPKTLAVSLLALGALAPAAARAHTAGGDVMVGSSRSPGDLESSTYIGFNLFGSAELRRQSLNLDFGYTLLNDGSTSVRHLLTLGVEYLPTDRWSFAVWGLAGPPRDATYRRLRAPPDDARIGNEYEVSDWSAGVNAAASYDSFGESDFEWLAELSAGLLHYDATQSEPAQPGAGSGAVSRSAAVNRLRLSATATAVLFRDTDVTLRASYYGYDASPHVAGFIQRASGPIGQGIATAPLRLELLPSVTQRFGKRWAGTLGFGFGRYVDGGDMLQTSVRATFRPDDALRLFGYVTGQRDLFGKGQPVFNAFAGLGADYRF